VGAAGVSEEKEKVEKREKLGGGSTRSHLGNGGGSREARQERWVVRLLFITDFYISILFFNNKSHIRI
jgi:hypothetical protein